MLGEDFFEQRRKRRSRQHMTVDMTNLGSKGKFQNFNHAIKGEYRLLALELCLETLRNLRGPSATRLLEMEINQLEGDIFNLLHRIEISPDGLKIVRSLAQQFLTNQASFLVLTFLNQFR